MKPLLVYSKQNLVPGMLESVQNVLVASGVDEAVLTDGGASAACWAKNIGYLSKSGRHQKPPNDENTITNYIIFKPNP